MSNLSFLSRVIEKVISVRNLKHIEANGINDNFQSAYKSGHRCETALIRVYNDIVTTIGKGNGSGLVLLDLSAAFDTIDHENLFNHLEKYVGISVAFWGYHIHLLYNNLLSPNYSYCILHNHLHCSMPVISLCYIIITQLYNYCINTVASDAFVISGS